MGAVRPLLIGFALVGLTDVRAPATVATGSGNPQPMDRAADDPVGRWRAEIDAAAARFGLPAFWIEQVMRAESEGRTHRGGRPIVSGAGAMGLMQLMPATWAEMRAAYGLGSDPHDPHDNIIAGAAYLRAMYDRFGYPGLFAAYNAGPARYAAYLSTGRALPTETRVYVARVTGTAEDTPRLAASEQILTASMTRPPGLFVLKSNPQPSASKAETPGSEVMEISNGRSENSLFAIRIRQ